MKCMSHLPAWGLVGLLVAGPAVHARDLGEGAANNSASKALQNADNRYALWSGIGRLAHRSGTSCTAALLDTRNRHGKAVGPAYLITAGHCVAFAYGTAHLDEPIDATITFSFFHDTPKQHMTYPTRMARWTSIVGTDLAILEVEASLATLIKKGINPLKLASHQHSTAHNVLNLGAPAGYKEKGLRLSACSEGMAGTFIDHPGVFSLAMRNLCDLRGGSSGSPMLDRQNNEITSIVSKVAATSSNQASPDCHATAACQAATFNYSYPANFLHLCFIEGIFDANAPDCSLKPVNLTVTQPWNIKAYVHTQKNTEGHITWPTWNFGFSLDDPFYRYKAVRNARDCQTPGNYSDAIHSEDAYINNGIGPQPGAHALCIMGVASPAQPLTRSSLKNAFTHAVYLTSAESMPRISPDYRVTWDLLHADFIHNFFYSAPADGQHCGDIDDPRYKPVPESITFAEEQLPIMLCSYVRNRSGQPSSIRTDLIERP
ncbi:serine protease [Pseudomonas purpurea]|uniref:trypsin-like serine peptidase n=1 Tax=Pseudomonas purpurea TaxID=3136737 RepID=UPI0032631C08